MATLSTLNLNHRIVRTPLDISTIPLKSITEKMVEARDSNKGIGLAKPDSEALLFYGLNHLIADLQVRKGVYGELSDEEEKLVSLYFSNVNMQAKRMFYYLLAICTRESRHVKTGLKVQIKDHLGKDDGQIFNDFADTIRGSGSSGTVDKLLNTTPEIKLGPFVRGLEYVFFNGSFSGGFGGSAWGEVAKTLRKCVSGEMSMELMIDCAYNLAHNNGPIFNKGVWYLTYSDTFIKILDVQRSGQIPIFIREYRGALLGMYMTDTLVDFLKLGMQVSPDLFKGYTDWYVVEACGSVAKYSYEKTQQVATYGESEKLKNVKEKLKKKEEELVKKKAIDEKDTLNLFNKTYDLVQRSE